MSVLRPHSAVSESIGQGLLVADKSLTPCRALRPVSRRCCHWQREAQRQRPATATAPRPPNGSPSAAIVHPYHLDGCSWAMNSRSFAALNSHYKRTMTRFHFSTW